MLITPNFIIGELYQLQLPDEFPTRHIWVWDVCLKHSVCLPAKPSPLILLYLGLYQGPLEPHFLIGNVPDCSSVNFPINVIIGSNYIQLVKPINHNDSTELST